MASPMVRPPRSSVPPADANNHQKQLSRSNRKLCRLITGEGGGFKRFVDFGRIN